MYSLLLFDRRTLIFFLVLFFIFLFHSTNNSITSSFVLHCIYPTSLRLIIYKKHKVVVTSNRCHLDRSPDICVKKIQNLLGAMSRGAEFHLGLLFEDAIFTKIQFTSVDTFQLTLFCKSLQRLFSCTFEPPMSKPGETII